MAKLVGGIAHGEVVQAVARWLIIPIYSNNRQPKQQKTKWLTQCKYERTNIIRNGEVIYRFVDGYYEPPKKART